jgi:hypothetical protein
VAKAAKAEAPESEAIEPDSAPTPHVVPKPPPDTTQPIDCSSVNLLEPYGVNQHDPVIKLGSAITNGIATGGLVERIVLHPNGLYVVHVRRGVATNMLKADRERMPMQYLVFRHGVGEVA